MQTLLCVPKRELQRSAGAIHPGIARLAHSCVSPDCNSLAAEEAGTAAKASLQKTISWCTTDAAGPSLGLLRAALLDLASVLIAEKAVSGALACLQAAATAGACLSALLTAPQDLGMVNSAAVPAWLSMSLQGELTIEVLHVSLTGMHVEYHAMTLSVTGRQGSVL